MGAWGTDLNKNGKVDPYEDPARPVEERVQDLLGQMTLEEKTCQLATLYGVRSGAQGQAAHAGLEEGDLERRHRQHR